MSSKKIQSGSLIFEYGNDVYNGGYFFLVRDLALKRVVEQGTTKMGLTEIELAERMKRFNTPQQQIMNVLLKRPI